MMQKSNAWIGVLLVLVIVVGFSMWWSERAKDAEMRRQAALTSREVALLCTTDMATEYHIHPELRIVILGEEQPLPPNIGITSTCMHSLHTHEGGGVIHVEAPVEKQFTLGDFFAVWKQNFSSEQILDTRVTPTTEIIVTINGARVDTYEDTVLRDKDKVVISYEEKGGVNLSL